MGAGTQDSIEQSTPARAHTHQHQVQPDGRCQQSRGPRHTCNPAGLICCGGRIRRFGTSTAHHERSPHEEERLSTLRALGTQS
eukprot:6185887-Pleurochrysis_carterae.AAC.2